MHGFGEQVILPLIRAVEPSVVVEIGAATGLMTRQLLPWAQDAGSTIRVVDPKPLFSVAEYERRWGDVMEFQEAMSIDVLPRCGDADVILLDGDHNWYTVQRELQIIDGLASTWPIVLMHDVNWPYARRDQYYAPDNVPREYRQPYHRGGIVRGQSALVDEGGKNPNGIHASHEGGDRNGVMTAIEDFLADTERELLLSIVRGPGGLGLLVAPDTLERHPGVVPILREHHDVGLTIALCPRYGMRELPSAFALDSG